MPITKRTLEKWRKEALHGYQISSYIVEGSNAIKTNEDIIKILHERVLRMTQELLDQHLIKREVR